MFPRFLMATRLIGDKGRHPLFMGTPPPARAFAPIHPAEDQPLDFSTKRSYGSWESKSPIMSDGSSNDEHNGGTPMGRGGYASPESQAISSPEPTPLSEMPQLRSRLAMSPGPACAAMGPLVQSLGFFQSETGSPSTSSAGGLGLPGLDPSVMTSSLLSSPLSLPVPTSLPLIMNGKNSTSGKTTRPFKAYPRDPLSVPLGFYGLPAAGIPGISSAEVVLQQASNEAYSKFREQMLASVQAAKRRSDSVTIKRNAEYAGSPPSMPTGSKEKEKEKGNESGGETSSVDVRPASRDSTSGEKRKLEEDQGTNKDEAYWERRRKNNEAAKRSREARRAKEDEIAIRAAFLEQENLKLRIEVAALKSETAKLRCMLFNS
ncbi:unnamed protein product [Darwinula stevensoni]|uniref:BZIP domain-containing protein n=1 Tax=Darwinula stevensoni TaxID=69355 RepID=A0A7R8X070_9CRUS|nr:unnamed protein product [Darwinula stevensoni]CAG0881372.1 unnamed protein product [Darwinula stevensoni]